MLLKTFGIVGLGLGLGLACGWFAYQSKFGGPAEFGPYSSGAKRVKMATVAIRPAEPGKAPKIEVVGGETFDFGVMEPGGRGNHSFVVRNVGEGPLELEIAGSTCKCTVGTLSDSTLAPGGETTIDLTWEAKTSSEEFGQSAILKTNDPSRGELNLIVRGRVINTMTMVPRNLSFGDTESGTPIVLESTIYSFNKTAIVPVGQTFSDPAMTQKAKFQIEEVPVETTPSEAYATAKQAFKLKIEIAPGLRQGAIRENLSLDFAPADAVDDQGEYDPDLSFRFVAETAGTIVGAIAFVESRRMFNGESGYIFTIGEFNPGSDKPVRANILLRGANRESMKLVLGEIEPAGVLRAELGEPLGRSNTVLVPLTLWVDPAAGPIELMGRGNDDYGSLWIRPDDPDQSPVRLKVRFAVPKK
jgi:hypothetical protein